MGLRAYSPAPNDRRAPGSFGSGKNQEEREREREVSTVRSNRKGKVLPLKVLPLKVLPLKVLPLNPEQYRRNRTVTKRWGREREVHARPSRPGQRQRCTSPPSPPAKTEKH